MQEVSGEWKITVPWGRIALVSWGDPSNEPMLLVHGRNDSVDTFRPLVKYLSKKYYYVAFDLPGNGESDPLPHGVQLERLHFVKAVELVAEHLGWTHFVYLSHSLGGELGMFYNSIHPNRITRMIQIDTIVLALVGIETQPWSNHYADFYHDYYTNNYTNNGKDARTYTKQRATEVVMRARGLTREQADLVLRRNLLQLGDDTYKLKWDKRQRALAPVNLFKAEYFKILTKNAPSTLHFISRFSIKKFATEEVLRIIADMKCRKSACFEVLEGGHDLHLEYTEEVAGCINKFLDRDFVAKL